MGGCEMRATSLLTLIVPAGLEEILTDWLLEHSSSSGFYSGPINSHSANQGTLTVAEQVSGRKRQIRFEVQVRGEEVDQMLDRLRGDFAGASIHFWVVPMQKCENI